jgi:sodium/potassium-transporting ATPase subunit alpha
MQTCTGESEPLDATAEAVTEDSGVSALEAHNIAFNSSLVIDGEAYGLVIRTGDNTFIGICGTVVKNPCVQAVWHD